MSKTTEQKAADEALTEAIELSRRAYGWIEGEAWVMSEYVVLAAAHRFDGDESFSSVGILYRDGDVPVHRALGLVEFAAARMRKLITGDD